MTTFTLARTATVAMIASAFVTLAPVAHAQAVDTLPQAEINIANTDFSSPKAVSHLITRLHRVAIDICMPDSQRVTPMNSDEAKCVDTAIKSGMAQIETKRQQAMRDAKVNVAAAH
jgi:UrcA family protein